MARLDRAFGHVEGADRIPIGGILGEVAARELGVLALDLRQALAVAGKHRVAGVDQREEILGELPRRRLVAASGRRPRRPRDGARPGRPR